MRDLKAIAKAVSEDMSQNTSWFECEVSFVLYGSHNSGYITQEHIRDTLDITKKNYGKRGSNLIAYCGNQSLQDIYDINANQALTVWKYLSKEEQGYFNALICELLENIEGEKLGALLAQLKKENNSSNNDLIAFYERKKIELILRIQDKINIGLRG